MQLIPPARDGCRKCYSMNCHHLVFVTSALDCEMSCITQPALPRQPKHDEGGRWMRLAGRVRCCVCLAGRVCECCACVCVCVACRAGRATERAAATCQTLGISSAASLQKGACSSIRLNNGGPSNSKVQNVLDLQCARHGARPHAWHTGG